jgi:hypothetical protein
VFKSYVRLLEATVYPCSRAFALSAKLQCESACGTYLKFLSNSNLSHHSTTILSITPTAPPYTPSTPQQQHGNASSVPNLPPRHGHPLLLIPHLRLRLLPAPPTLAAPTQHRRTRAVHILQLTVRHHDLEWCHEFPGQCVFTLPISHPHTLFLTK